MEDRYRAFEPVQIGMISVESAFERFYKDRERQPPTIAYWRVNLTALSQRYNLYFIATADQIQVYQPEFPYQTLGHRPSLTIVPQLSNPTAEGYIDESQPHNINHVIVGNLGNQEILLFSTDSGNVVAYYTSSIRTEVEKLTAPGAIGHSHFTNIRPFFTQWVYESAWGLAIHSEGRMIAVSANTPRNIADDDYCAKITVFAFALTMPEWSKPGSGNNLKRRSNPFDESLEWNAWSISADGFGPDAPERDRNYKIVLGGYGGHEHNVPCVAFVNGPEDAAGSWLLSTDIKGEMKMWQIWKGRCLRTWDFNAQSRTTASFHRELEAGWLVAALDIYSFRPAESMDKFIGRGRAPPYRAYPSLRDDSYDLTGIVHGHIPQSSNDHPNMEDLDGDTSEEEEEEDELDADVADSEFEANMTHLTRAASASSRASSEDWLTSVPIASTENPSEQANGETFGDESSDNNSDYWSEEAGDPIGLETAIDDSDIKSDDVLADADIDDDDDEDDLSFTSPETATSSFSCGPEDRNGTEGLYSSNHSSEGSASMPASPTALGIKQHARSFVETRKLEDQIQLPLVPIIHCSASHVRMFSGPTALYPHIFCARLLRQNLPQAMANGNIGYLDRLCMLQQIPELGIVLIATQIGRCAICSLTKRTADGLLGLRVDWIVPTKKQEQNRNRPADFVLLGIAASPLQGRSKPDASVASEYDTDQNWAKDRMVGGTHTTFDPEVVTLRTRLEQVGQGGDADFYHPERTGKPREKREWIRPTQKDRWEAFENSRRYRLMLTYSDMTVLTYELSRGVEREDIAPGLDLDSLD